MSIQSFLQMRAGQPGRPPSSGRASLIALLGWLGFAVLLGLGTGQYLAAVDRTARTGMASEAQADAVSLEQVLLRVFETARAQLDLLESRGRMLAEREDAAARGIEQHLSRSLEANRFGLAGVGTIGLDGVMAYSSQPSAMGLQVGDRETVAAHLRGEAPGLLVSRPLLGRASGRWTLLVTRPLLDAAGRMQAVGVVMLDPVAISRQFGAQMPRPGRLAVLRRLEDGSLLARSRDPESDLARPPAPDHPLVQAARTGLAGTTAYRSTRDNRAVVAGWRVPEGLPLVAAAVIDEDVALAGPRLHRLAVLTIASLLALFALGLALAIAAWVEAQQERARLAEAMAQQRRDILATLAHEIRTPLTGMLGFSELLAEAQLPPDQARQAATVVESGQVLLALLNDILDLAKLEAGKVSLERLPFRPAELLAGAAALAEGAARRKGLQMQLVLPPELPDWVEGDPTRTRQIIGNLLSNAVKFTHAGSVTLAATVESRREDGGVMLAIEVRDTGIGMAAEMIPRLFGLFEQGDASISRHYGGTGLGLAICRRLAEAMGGHVEAESRPGEGSCFRLHLPLGPALAPAPELPSPSPVGPARTLSVLVADDTPANLALVRAYLGTAGHRAVTAATGVEAVALAQAERFDAILLDLNMPEMDGPEAARHIRAAGPNRATPILALTAGTAAEDQARVREAGMDAHLAKPIGKAALLRALAAAVEKAAQRELHPST